MKLEEIWTEENLAKQLGIIIKPDKKGKTGRSRTITKLIGEGLECIPIFGRRYFAEEDIVKLMLKFKKEKQSQALQ